MKKFKERDCRIYEVFYILSRKWNTFIILELGKDKGKFIRYTELKLILEGITPRAFSQRLKDLEEWKIIVKKEEMIKNQKVTKYKLSKQGLELLPTIKSLRDWGKRIDICKLKPSCNKCEFMDNCFIRER